jgi:hypothetical protein
VSLPALGIGFTLIGAIALTNLGCGGERATTKTETPASDINSFIAQGEKGFDPSIYNPEVDILLLHEQSLYTKIESTAVFTTVQPETIPGFRIQVVLTQEIDQAMAIRDSLAKEFQEENVYVVYDAPTYKIRIGNYPDRSSASPLLKQLVRRGYPDAWIVPDNVLKNPPPRLPDQPIEPKNPLENKRQ